jgi:ligand-binding sensor domain-containing protein
LCAFPHLDFTANKDIIRSLAAFEQEKLLCSRENSGFIYLNANEIPTTYSPTSGNFAFSNVQQVAFTPDGSWLIGHAGGVARKQFDTWTNWDTASIGLTFEYSSMTTIKARPDGWMAVGTLYHGAAVFNGQEWLPFNTDNSPLPSNQVLDLAFGPDNCLYFATFRGLVVWDGHHWTVHNTNTTGIPNFGNLKSVAVLNNGDVWTTFSGNRIALLRDGIWSHLNLNDLGIFEEGNRVGRLLVDANQRLWLSATKTISMLDRNGWNHFTNPMKDNTDPFAQPTFTVDGTGQVWIADRTLHKWIPETSTSAPSKEPTNTQPNDAVKISNNQSNTIVNRFFVDLPYWNNQVVRFEIFDKLGKQWYTKTTIIQNGSYTIELPDALPKGEFMLHARNDSGKRLVGRFVRT